MTNLNRILPLKETSPLNALNSTLTFKNFDLSLKYANLLSFPNISSPRMNKKIILTKRRKKKTESAQTNPSLMKDRQVSNLLSPLEQQRLLLLNKVNSSDLSPKSFESMFRKLYANIQFSILSPNKVPPLTFQKSQSDFHKQINNLHECTKNLVKSQIDPINSAVKLIENFNKLKTRGFYTTNFSNSSNDILLKSEEFVKDIEQRAEHYYKEKKTVPKMEIFSQSFQKGDAEDRKSVV